MPCSLAGAMATTPVFTAFSISAGWRRSKVRCGRTLRRYRRRDVAGNISHGGGARPLLHWNGYAQERRPFATGMNVSIVQRSWHEEKLSCGKVSVSASQRTAQAKYNRELPERDNLAGRIEIPFLDFE